MPRFHLPLAVDFSTRTHLPSTAAAKATYIQNGFVKKDNTVKIYNRPALKQFTSGDFTTVNVIAGVGTDKVYAVIYTPSATKTEFVSINNHSSNTVHIATLFDTAAAGTYTSCDILPIIYSSDNYWFIKFNGLAGAGLYTARIVSSTGTVTDISDADFPNKATLFGAAWLDGYVFVMSSAVGNYIYNCDVNDPTSWNAAGYIIPSLNGGAGVGIDTYKNHVIMFGTKNIQFFYDAAEAAPGSPLLPRQDLVYNFGVHQSSSIKPWWKSRTGDILSFIGKTHDGKKFIGLFNDFQVEQISNTFINGLLDEYSNLSISGYSYYGKTFIHVVLNNQISLYYDIEEKVWSVFSSSIADFVTNSRVVDYIENANAVEPTLLTYCDGTSSSANAGLGKLYYFDQPENAHTDVEDDGTTTHTVDLVIQTPRYRGEPGVESQRKFMHELQVIGDTLTSADTLSIQYSDDDYQNFITARTVDLTASLKQLQRLGYFRERAFKISYTGTQQVRLEAIEGQIQVGTN